MILLNECLRDAYSERQIFLLHSFVSRLEYGGLAVSPFHHVFVIKKLITYSLSL